MADAVGSADRAVAGVTGRSPDGAGELADRIAAAVTSRPAVARLATGPLATYLPHRTVPGVAIRDRVIAVAVVARYGYPMAEVADQVRTAVRPLVPDWPVDVDVADLDTATDRQPGELGSNTESGGHNG